MTNKYREKIEERMENPNRKVSLSELLHASIPYDQYLCQAQEAHSERDRDAFVENMRKVIDHLGEIEEITGVDMLVPMRRFGSAIESAEEGNWSDVISFLFKGDVAFWEKIDESEVEVKFE